MTGLSAGAADFTFIHLTDLHLAESDDGQINGQAPADRLRRVLARLRATCTLVADTPDPQHLAQEQPGR